MTRKRAILESLAKKRLIDLAYTFEIEAGPTTLSKDELVDELARMRRTKLEEVLPEFSRDELKTACLWLDLDASGRSKQVIIDRILDSENGQSRAARGEAKPSRGRRSKMSASTDLTPSKDHSEAASTPAVANGDAHGTRTVP